MLTDYLGNDLSKLANELEKLIISLPANNAAITADLIEKNIGISKDYNNFELQKAIAYKDVLKANRIAFYFEQNPKKNPLIVTLIVLFNFFSNLMICHYEKNKTEPALMATLGLRFSFQVEDYIWAIQNYSPNKTFEIISLIREFDAKSKGVNNFSLLGALRRRIDFYNHSASVCRHSGTPMLYATLGAYRRQSRLGRSLGGRRMAFFGRLRTGK
ncbi:hypothetical protein FACS1894160_4870 [Bacteroidia bacterium]|nr:hypothetical protein FACS1894160_4870 [Bacteroidia bacterium]